MTDHVLPPKPSNEIKTLRKIGYSLETSIADILDNSITAKSKKIEIEIPYSDQCEPYISIKDDGAGMSKEELIENMRLGCKDPDQEREPGDLGRFGSGMKTASFSQAKKLIVISKVKGKPPNAAIWDIERIEKENEWILETLAGKELSKISHLKINKDTKSGTQVLWLNIDRYEKVSHGSHHNLEQELVKDIVNIKRAIAVFFHRFIKVEQEDKKDINKIKVIVNGDEIEAIDPFMRDCKGYQWSGDDVIIGREGKTFIAIHNVPHPDKLKKQELDDIGGVEFYNSRQGFYIYRDKRLMIEGDWLGTHAAGFLGNRARVQVDMPSSMDHIWGTDVKKASFQFPPQVMHKFRTLSRKATNVSKRDYKRRSKTTGVINDYWDIIEDPQKNTTEYRINLTNWLLKEISRGLNKENREKLAQFLTNLAKYLPLKHILFSMGNNPKDVNKASVNWRELLNKLTESE